MVAIKEEPPVCDEPEVGNFVVHFKWKGQASFMERETLIGAKIVTSMLKRQGIESYVTEAE